MALAVILNGYEHSYSKYFLCEVRKTEKERERERDELDIRYLCCSLCLDFVSISHFGVDPHLCICAAFD